MVEHSAEPNVSGPKDATPGDDSCVRRWPHGNIRTHLRAPGGQDEIGRLAEGLSERDWAVIRLIGQHKYLTTRQMEGFCFADHATLLTGSRVCRRVLRRLCSLRVLQPLERRIGGVRAGSASYVRQLGSVGRRLLPVGRRTRPHEPGALFLGHTLAVADAHLTLVVATRAGSLTLERMDVEPDCWRNYTGLGGARLTLKPDLYAVIGDPADQDYENRWFIEVDRGTEHQARLLEKCHRYLDYQASGVEQRDGGGFPLVVWAMASPEEVGRLEDAIAMEHQLSASGLFRVTTHDGLAGLVAGGSV